MLSNTCTSVNTSGFITLNSGSGGSTTITGPGTGNTYSQGTVTTWTSASTSTTGTVFNSTGGTNVVFTNGGNQLTVTGSAPLIELLAEAYVKIKGKDYDTGGSLLKIDAGEALAIQLPDETTIFVRDDGSYEIVDGDLNTVRRRGATVLEFNRFINASDLLEEFIKDLGVVGVKQDEVLNVPIDLFINWLVIRAAEQDGETPPEDVPKLEASTKYKPPQCKFCGKFVSAERKKLGMLFCNADHYQRFEKKVGLNETMVATS